MSQGQSRSVRDVEAAAGGLIQRPRHRCGFRKHGAREGDYSILRGRSDWKEYRRRGQATGYAKRAIIKQGGSLGHHGSGALWDVGKNLVGWMAIPLHSLRGTPNGGANQHPLAAKRGAFQTIGGMTTQNISVK
jgi:hypothetical protein